MWIEIIRLSSKNGCRKYTSCGIYLALKNEWDDN